MNDPTGGTDTAPGDDLSGNARHYKRDFWAEENLKFVQPHFRLQKAARIVNGIGRGKDCSILDVGCGPATLMRLLPGNIHYYGIDIAIHDHQASNLVEADFLECPIRFGDKKFDIVLAQGVFEYVGMLQARKFAEISQLLVKDGKFIVSYWNFGHLNSYVYKAFSNIQPLREFRSSLASYFDIDKSFPVSHNWHHHGPGRKFMRAAQAHVNINIPLISPAFAVEYFFICSPRAAEVT
jgi:SAM-dependent methyltransferase